MCVYCCIFVMVTVKCCLFSPYLKSSALLVHSLALVCVWDSVCAPQHSPRSLNKAMRRSTHSWIMNLFNQVDERFCSGDLVKKQEGQSCEAR